MLGDKYCLKTCLIDVIENSEMDYEMDDIIEENWERSEIVKIHLPMKKINLRKKEEKC